MRVQSFLENSKSTIAIFHGMLQSLKDANSFHAIVDTDTVVILI